MSLVCAISGVPPEEPVLSSSGYIFEKRLIVKELELNKKCPISGKDMTADDLQQILVSKVTKPRPLTASSIPGLLSLFQNEWDALMHETFTLKTHLDQVRNQLSQSLYQHDAATRVIARVIRERDAARHKVSQLQQQLANVQGSPADVNGREGALRDGQSPGEREPGLSEELMNAIQENSKVLLANRKRRQTEGYTASNVMKELRCVADYSLHSTTTRGVKCIDIDPKQPRTVVTGGMDGAVVVFDTNTRRTVSKLLGHTKKVNAVKAHPRLQTVLSCSDDKTVRIWQCSQTDGASKQFGCSHVIRKHNGEVTDLSLHPMDNYFVSCAKDCTYSIFELDSGRCLRTTRELPCEYRCVSFHPDGMIVGGGGTDGGVHIWDVRGPSFRAALLGHDGPINGISFSENGFYMATGSDDGTVRLWDLRKSISFQTITLEDTQPVNNVNFDQSGHFLTVAASALSVYHFESRSSLVKTVGLSDHTDAVMDARFGPLSAYLLSASMDRTVRLWEPEGIVAEGNDLIRSA